MLPKHYQQIGKNAAPVFRRYRNGELTEQGSFPYGCSVTFETEIPKRLGVSAVVLRLARDGEEPKDHPLSFINGDMGKDIFSITFQTSEFSSPEGELLFYEFLFLRGCETLFSDTEDNLGLTLKDSASNRFRMLITKPGFETPDWFKSGTMYHIFLDRFCRGTGEVSLTPGATLNEDWEHGIPPFPEKNGDELSNNVFFGGNLWGVIEKLDYLQSLGITVLYLSPVFKSASNHRYDTGNYLEIDPLLGGEKAFDLLLSKAHERGMRVILDGVFNHTGDDSIYFNRYGSYPSVGAYQSQNSPYREWFRFKRFPDEYECWWGIKILPRLNHETPACRTYFTGKNGIAAHWIEKGIDGWRLDVADELSDGFLDEFCHTVKKKSGNQGIVIGEVWENAAEKTAYGKRRKYLRGNQLDSVMNYPFRNAVSALFLQNDTEQFVHILTEIYATYPRQVSDCLMNLLGTHDTERILTVLGDDGSEESLSNAELSTLRLTETQRKTAKKRLELASVLQYTVYGIPSVYYGDEAGLEGYHDPFCRLPFPWGKEDAGLLAHYRKLGKLRREHPALWGGDFRFLSHGDGFFFYERARHSDRILVGVNLSPTAVPVPLKGTFTDWKTGEKHPAPKELSPHEYILLTTSPKKETL